MINKNPYYIVTPPYRRTSAGIRVLYRLCSLLNLSGYQAYLFIYPYQHIDLASSPVDNTPILTEDIAQYHLDIGLTPIVIAPELMDISKFNPPVFVRYYLHYKSFLDDIHDDSIEDFSLFYTRGIRDKVQGFSEANDVLLILVSDPFFFTPPAINSNRAGCAFYAAKYKDTFNQKIFSCTDECIEITRDKPTSQTPEQIRDIFRSVEVFYSYEDTALTLEANLCGCPVVYLTNDYFEAPLIQDEIRKFGYSLDNSEKGIDYAKSTVDKARELLLKYYISPLELNNNSFIEKTQGLAKDKKYIEMFAKKYFYKRGFLFKYLTVINHVKVYIRDYGILWVLKKAYIRIRNFRINF